MYLAEEIVIAEGSLERKERERGRGINEVKTERESASERVREREAFQACAMLWRQRAGKSQTNRWSDKNTTLKTC